MNIVRIILTILFTLSSFTGYNQKRTIEFESNGRSQAETAKNPFAKFIGEWTLKDDTWTQNWGNGTETIKIPNHHTVSQQINTNNSLLSIIDGPEPNGHILWSYNPNTKEIHHISSFGTLRVGNGKGSINNKGDIVLKLQFEDEPKDTYRKYEYTWLNRDEYHMISTQYDKNNQPTGLFYEGNFVRVDAENTSRIREEIRNILKVLDNNEISLEQQLDVYSNDVIHMAPNTKIIRGKESLKTYLLQQRSHGTSQMNHHILDYEIAGEKVIMRGFVIGTFYPINDKKSIEFQTKNLFIFGRDRGVLKIENIIYNMTPLR